METLRFLNYQNGCYCHLEHLIMQNFIGCQGPEGWHASPFQISSKLVNTLWRYCCFFSIFQDVGCRHLGLSIRKILLADGVWTAQTHHCAKFRQNRSYLCWDIVIFLTFKMATAAILNFWNRKFSRVQRVETHKRAKFCKNWSISSEDINIFCILRWRPSAIFSLFGAYLDHPHRVLWGLSLWKIWLWSMQWFL